MMDCYLLYKKCKSYSDAGKVFAEYKKAISMEDALGQNSLDGVGKDGDICGHLKKRLSCLTHKPREGAVLAVVYSVNVVWHDGDWLSERVAEDVYSKSKEWILKKHGDDNYLLGCYYRMSSNRVVFQFLVVPIFRNANGQLRLSFEGAVAKGRGEIFAMHNYFFNEVSSEFGFTRANRKEDRSVSEKIYNFNKESTMLEPLPEEAMKEFPKLKLSKAHHDVCLAVTLLYLKRNGADSKSFKELKEDSKYKQKYYDLLIFALSALDFFYRTDDANIYEKLDISMEFVDWLRDFPVNYYYENLYGFKQNTGF